MGAKEQRKPWKLGDPEPAGCRKAFEDYWAMGEGRSLDKLAATYRKGDEWGPDKPPCTKARTLGEWSVRYRWQERIALREQELADKAWALAKRSISKRRARDLAICDAALDALATEEGGASLAQLILVQPRAGDVATMMKIQYQLLGEPLVDRQEVTGAGGEPVRVQAEVPKDATPEQIAEAVVAALRKVRRA